MFAKLFRPMTLLQLAQTELLEAQKEMLKAHSIAEHAQSVLAYDRARVARLSAYIKQHNPEAAK